MGLDLDLYEYKQTLSSMRDIDMNVLHRVDSFVANIEVGDVRLPDEVNRKLRNLGLEDGTFVTVLISR